MLKSFEELFLYEYVSGNSEDKLLNILKRKFTCSTSREVLMDFIIDRHFSSKVTSTDYDEIIDDFYREMECK